MTPKTKNAVIFIEGLPPVNDIEVKEASHDLNKIIRNFCGGDIELFLLNRNFNEITF